MSVSSVVWKWWACLKEGWGRIEVLERIREG